MIAPKLSRMRSPFCVCRAQLTCWLTLLLAICLLQPTKIWAQDHILEKAYWTDSTGTATFEQARNAHYTPYSGVLSKGFGSQAQWVRLRVKGVPIGSSDRLVLRIRPVFLDNITLYDPLELAQGKGARSTGDRTPFQSTEFESLHHTFVIPAQQDSRYIWLRLQTTSTQLMHVEALTPREMLRQEHTLWLAYSALLALLFSSLLWVLISWLQDRDQVNGLFVLRQTILLIYTASYLGYHRLLLDGVLSAYGQDLLFCWLLVLSTGLTFLFENRLLREYVIPAWGARLMLISIGTSLFLAVSLLTGYRELALQGNTIIIGWGILCMLLTAIHIQQRSHDQEKSKIYQLPKYAIVTHYTVVLGVLGVSIMPSLGLLQGTTISIYGVLLYGVLSGLFMTALLIVRSRHMDRLRREQANHLFLSREQLAIETRRRQDQSQLLNMLMHELKTPLAVIDLALKDRAGSDSTQGYVGRAIDNMKTILHRCVQTDRLVERPFEVHIQRFDLALQLQQWVQDNKQAEGRTRLQTLPAAPVETDLQCVQIIASNLIENALKYGDPQQPVTITLQVQPRADGRVGLCLGVSNAPGPAGRPEADKVFAKYYRSAAAQRQSGTGLGLFLSHNLAQHIGADLRYLPSETHICFELWLPT